MTTTPDSEALSELERLEKEATKGYWIAMPWHIEEGPPCVRHDVDRWVIATTSSDANSKFIAAMRNKSLPLLHQYAGRVRELEGEVTDYRREFFLASKRADEAESALALSQAREERLRSALEGEIFYAFAFGMGEDGGLDQGYAQITWKKAKEFAERRMKAIAEGALSPTPSQASK